MLCLPVPKVPHKFAVCFRVVNSVWILSTCGITRSNLMSKKSPITKYADVVENAQEDISLLLPILRGDPLWYSRNEGGYVFDSTRRWDYRIKHLWGFFLGAGGSKAATMAWEQLVSLFDRDLQCAICTRKATNLVENVLQLVLGQSTALHVLDGAKFLSHSLSVFLTHRLHLLLRKLLPDAGIVPQVCLGTDNEARYAGAMVMNFRKPFLSNVLERSRRRDAEAH